MTVGKSLAAAGAILLGCLALSFVALSVIAEIAEMEPELRYDNEHNK